MVTTSSNLTASPIHGAVDGFSRKVIWLKLARSNNNPVVPVFFYFQAIRTIGKLPLLLRTDCGTETSMMAGLHSFLHNDISLHQYGKSVTNQRIENWWSHYRRGYSNWHINFFKQLVDNNIYELGNYVHAECAWFVFSDLLKCELNEVKRHWNSHYIRKSTCSATGGIPDDLFYLPERYGFQDCGISINETDLQRVIQERDFVKEAAAVLEHKDEELIEYFKYIRC